MGGLGRDDACEFFCRVGPLTRSAACGGSWWGEIDNTGFADAQWGGTGKVEVPIAARDGSPWGLGVLGAECVSTDRSARCVVVGGVNPMSVYVHDSE